MASNGAQENQIAPGLSADWLNAWLAAIGVTVLVPQVRLGWTDDPVPKARFAVPPGQDLAELIAAALPALEDLERLLIADLRQKVPEDTYREVAEQARERHDDSLAVLISDLSADRRGDGLPTGPFNVGAPRGETVFTRLRACRQRLDDTRLAEQAQTTLDGHGQRHEINGLGFDYSRIAASVPGEADKLVDPIVESLCFFGLLLHPLSGDGRQVRQRGWSQTPTRRHALRWPTWSASLDRWAIDALLDIVYKDAAYRSPHPWNSGDHQRLPPTWLRLGITALFGVVSFRAVGSSDTTRGYASERLL